MDIGIASGGFSSSAEIVETVEPRLGTPVSDAAGELAAADVDVVIASGWPEIRTYLRAGGDGAILAVEEPPGLAPVSSANLPDALDAIASEAYEHVEHTTLTVSAGGSTHERVTETMVMTTEPATISEFGVRYAGEQICEYRADGIVVATPPTAVGYARAAGGPRVDTSVPAAVVVPVAPYRTNPDEWVLREPVTVEVVRDEGAVGLFVDDEEVSDIACGEAVEFTPAGRYRSVCVASGRSPLESRP